MDRGFQFPTSRRASPPGKGRSELKGLSRMGSNQRQQVTKQELNIDDFGDMDSDEDEFQNLAANFVTQKPPAHPQYNLVPHGFLRDDDDLCNEDYDGVPIDSATSSPNPLSPARPWQRSPSMEEMKGDPITVLGPGNRSDPMLPRWAHPKRDSKDKLHIDRFSSGTASFGASSTYEMETSSGTHYPRGKSKWESSAGQIGGKKPGMSTASVKGPAFVRAKDESNLFLAKPSSSDNRNFVDSKDERNLFPRASLESTSSNSSKNAVPSKPVAFPGKNVGYPPRCVKSSSTWKDPPSSAQSNLPTLTELSRESPDSKNILPTSDPNVPQIGLLQAAALQQALAGITHLDPQAGLNLLMQASQNPTLAAVLAGNVTNTGMSGLQLPFGNPAVKAPVESTVPVAKSDVVITANLSVPPPGYTGGSRAVPCTLPDGSGATRYPAPDLASLVFDPSTGYRFDKSTGLHYDANSGYFFNSKLKIFLHWDKFTQTYLRVENPPANPRVNLPTDSPASTQEIHQPSKSLPSFNQGLATLNHIPSSNFREYGSSVQSNIPPNSYSGGSQTTLDATSYQTIECKPSTRPLPNLAETSLFNKLRKAKLAANTKPPATKQWGEPDPLLESLQKSDSTSNQPETGVLNLEEILQRSRQFMKGSTKKLVNSGDMNMDKPSSARGGKKDLPQRTTERLNSEGIQNRQGLSTLLPRPDRDTSRESPIRRRQNDPHSRRRSPDNKTRDRKSPSPQAKRRSTYKGASPSRSRSPQFKKSSVKDSLKSNDSDKDRLRHGRATKQSGSGRKISSRSRSPLSPRESLEKERVRRRRLDDQHSRQRSPVNRTSNRKSPLPSGQRPTHREASPSRIHYSHNRRHRRSSRSPRCQSPRTGADIQRSVSHEEKKRDRSSNQRDDKLPEPKCRRTSKGRSSNRKPSVTGSCSPDSRQRRSRGDRTPSPAVRVVIDQSPGGTVVVGDERKSGAPAKRTVHPLSRTAGGSSKPNQSPRSRNVKDRGDDFVKPLSGVERLEKKESNDRSCEQKAHSLVKKGSKPNNKAGVSGYKSLSNLRNQTKDKSKDTHVKQDPKSQQIGEHIPSMVLSTAEDDERQSHENHRLVNERTFSANWKKKKQESNEAPALVSSEIPSENPINSGSKGKDLSPLVSYELDELQESNEFDFLIDALDDCDNEDDESTVIDEYEEILDYHDLDSNSELKVSESNAPEKNELCHGTESEKLNKEVMDPATIDSIDNKGKSASEKSVHGSLELPGVADPSSVSSQVTETRVESSEPPDKQTPREGTSMQTYGEVVVDESVDCGSDGIKPPSVATTIELETQGPMELQSLKPVFSKDGSVTGYPGINNGMKAEGVKPTPKEPSNNFTSATIGNEKQNVVDSSDCRHEECPGSDVRSGKTNPSILSVSPKKLKNVVNKEAKESAANPKFSDAVSLSPKIVDQPDLKDIGLVVKHTDSDQSVVEAKNEPVAGCGRLNEEKKVNPQIKEDESLIHARSVSDIEKFLLLSSQEVELKRDQGVDSNVSSTEKKNGVFSRLGGKLPENEKATESLVAAKPAEAHVLPLKPPKLAAKLRPNKKSELGEKKPKLDDPCKTLFVDDPTSVVLVGPMNFIEPSSSFIPFTKKYLLAALEHEGADFIKIYVSHEDSTGAPFHYALITFPSPRVASAWVDRHKGVYKGDPKIFKTVPGHTKQKLVPDAVAFLHFTELNWVCLTCRKFNFPPRSLCYNCFQNRDPDGFSPLVIADKMWKQTNWVGAPKLKFFATKEKVLESTPPLDGFDILRIEMVMDEEMGLPAGICVFELPSFIEAGKLKKFFKNRNIEAVSVQMHKRFLEDLSHPFDSGESPSRILEDADIPVPEADETGGQSPAFSSREVRVTMGCTSLDRFSRSRGIQSTPQCEEGKFSSPVRSVRAVLPRTIQASSPSPNIDIDPTYKSTESGYHSEHRSASRNSPVRDCGGQSRSPVSRQRSPVPRSCSPVSRQRSPIPRSRSPVSRRRSPVPRIRSPIPRQLSPVPRSRSPVPRRLSPVPRSRSQIPRRRSPVSRSRSPVPRQRSPVSRRYSPFARHCSPSPPPRSRSPLPRHSPSFADRPIKPDGRSNWTYPPPDSKNFKFEPRSGLDYDPTTTLYYEPKSCCFYNDDSNEWLEYDPKTGLYRVVQ